MPRRQLLAVTASAFAAAVVWIGHAPPDYANVDARPLYLAAHAVSRGTDPYQTVHDSLGHWLIASPLYYPATAPVFMAPFGALPYRLAVTLFTGLGVGLLAWSLAPWRWPILLSAPLFHAVVQGQWSPWTTAAIGLPWLGLVWAAKPSVGLALFAGWPNKGALIGGALLVALSLLLVPGWPLEWRSALQYTPQYLAPIQRPFGWLLLLALLRWQRPEARMLAAIALIPHTTTVHEMLPLLLIAQRPRDLWVLVGLGWIGFLGTAALVDTSHVPAMLAAQWPVLLLLGYLPALVLVLAQKPDVVRVMPNSGK